MVGVVDFAEEVFFAGALAFEGVFDLVGGVPFLAAAAAFLLRVAAAFLAAACLCAFVNGVIFLLLNNSLFRVDVHTFVLQILSLIKY